MNKKHNHILVLVLEFFMCFLAAKTFAKSGLCQETFVTLNNGIINSFFSRSNKEVIYDIKRIGKKINSFSISDVPIVSLAAGYSTPEILKAIIEQGAYINDYEIESDSPIYYAISNGRSDNVEIILNKGYKLEKYYFQSPLKKSFSLYASLLSWIKYYTSDFEIIANKFYLNNCIKKADAMRDIIKLLVRRFGVSKKELGDIKQLFIEKLTNFPYLNGRYNIYDAETEFNAIVIFANE